MRTNLLPLLCFALPWFGCAAQAAHDRGSVAVPAGIAAQGMRAAGEVGRIAGERAAADPNQGQILLLGTRIHGLWRSADAGASWHRVRTFPALPLNNVGLPFVGFDRRSGVQGQPTPVIFVGVADPVLNLMRSVDGGRSWKPVAGGPIGMFPERGEFETDGTLRLSYATSPGAGGAAADWALNPRTGEWRDLRAKPPAR